MNEERIRETVKQLSVAMGIISNAKKVFEEEGAFFDTGMFREGIFLTKRSFIKGFDIEDLANALGASAGFTEDGYYKTVEKDGVRFHEVTEAFRKHMEEQENKK